MDSIKILNYNTYITEREMEILLIGTFFHASLDVRKVYLSGPLLKRPVLLRQLLEALVSRSAKDHWWTPV